MSMVSWFHTFRDVNGFISFVGSSLSWFRRFRGVNGFMVIRFVSNIVGFSLLIH